MRHPFSFDGGDYLTTIGACWFVSYAFYERVDNNHTSWRKVETWQSRKSTYCRTRTYHHDWLEQILKMNDAKLNQNTLNLTASEIKSMATQILKIV